MRNFILKEDGFYRYKSHLYTKENCEFCDTDYYRRKDKTNQKFCSNNCNFSSIGEKNRIDFTSLDMKILNGCLLSDGSISKGKNNRNYRFTQFCIKSDYIDFLNLNTKFKTRVGIKKSHKRYNESLGQMINAKESYYIASNHSPSFNDIRAKWYPNGKKIVPRDLIINPTTLLHWYLGDGYIDYNGIGLCTDSFSEEDNLWLINQLSKSFKCVPQLNKKNRIIIPNKYVFEFIQYIGHCPVESFEYKWDSIVKESYYDRKCVQCGDKFDTEQNHKKFCSDKCSKKFSYLKLKNII